MKRTSVALKAVGQQFSENVVLAIVCLCLALERLLWCSVKCCKGVSNVCSDDVV